jgi:predicted MFS family arabinose efflux permease
VLGIRDKNIWLVYAAIFLLGTAYGASLSVTPLQLAVAHFTTEQIGTLAIGFAGGIVAMSIPAGALVRRLSAKRSLALSLVVYAIAVVLFPLQTTYPGTFVVRAIDGAASVGIWVACETVLLARSEKARKALVMSLYAIAIAIGYLTGSGLARVVALFVSGYRTVFFGAGALAALTGVLVVIALDRDAHVPANSEENDPGSDPPPSSSSSSIALLYRIKTSAIATFAYGYFQAAVVLFLPLYLVESKHVDKDDTILIVAFFAGGMLLFSSVAARIGDRIGHLRVMAVLAIVGISMIIGFVVLTSWPLMCAAIFVAGATLASISPLSLALQGHIVSPAEYSRANGLYNACYAFGMLLGPPISSVIMTRYGGATMLYHFAALWTVFVASAIVFRADDPRARAERVLEAVGSAS